VTSVVFVALALFCSVAGGWIAYRRTLGRGSYQGTVKGALAIASVLGLFLGLTIGFATLLVVLALRVAR